MEMQGLHVNGRVFNTKVSSNSNNIVIDFDIPAGFPARLDAAIGARNKWFDLKVSHSAVAVYNGQSYMVTRII
jgi:hypothetical protein